MSLGKGSTPVTGYRYYFSLLMGIARGPIDQVFQITAGGTVLWDGAPGVSSGIDFPSGIVAPIVPALGDPYSTADGGSWAGGAITDTELNVPLNKPNLFGGDAREGGIDGSMDLYMGDADQTLGSRILSIMGGLRLSNLRGVVTCFFDGEVCANNPYPKAFKFRVRRALKGWDGDTWYPDRAVIMLTDDSLSTQYSVITADGEVITTTNSAGDYSQTTTSGNGSVSVVTHTADGGTTSETLVQPQYNSIYSMNPAHIVYECCTNRDWGRGLDRALIDNISFTSCANQLYTEQFGLCIKWSRSDDIDTFLQSVIDHIGAVIYTDKVSGLLCMRLIRGGYTVADLPVFDYNHGLLEISNSEAGSRDTTANEVIVKYNSPVLDSDKEARAQNIADINGQGSVFSVTRQYPGLPTAKLAVLVAQRELKVMSSGIRRLEFTLDRRAYRIVPGDVIVLNAPDRHIDNMIVRVATIEEATITDGKIKITGAQDTFAQPITPFIGAPENTYRTPNPWPTTIPAALVQEATYRDIFKFSTGDAEAKATPRDACYMAFLAEPPTRQSLSFDLWGSVGHVGSSTFSDYELKGTSHFSRTAVTLDDIAIDTTQIRVDGMITAHTVYTNSAIYLKTGTSGFGEFCKLVGITRGTDGIITLTVTRGCVDTIARPHVAGTKVWAYDQASAADTTQYANNDTIGYKPLVRTSKGVLTLESYSAPFPFLGGTNLRQNSPYPGANFMVDFTKRDRVVSAGPDVRVTWAHRHRLIQQDILFDETMASIGPEPGVYYQIFFTWGGFAHSGFFGEMVDAGVGATKYTGNNFVLTNAMFLAHGIPSGPITLTLQTFRTDAGFPIDRQSGDQASCTFNYIAGTGWSYDFGNNWGT